MLRDRVLDWVDPVAPAVFMQPTGHATLGLNAGPPVARIRIRSLHIYRSGEIRASGHHIAAARLS